MKKGELTIGKWHFKLGLLPRAFTLSCGKMFFHFGIFKLLSYPPEGCMIAKENYKGFWLRKEWEGIDIGFYF